jgi:hypothetical protein
MLIALTVLVQAADSEFQHFRASAIFVLTGSNIHQ